MSCWFGCGYSTAKVSDEIFEALAAQTVVLPAEPTWGEVI